MGGKNPGNAPFGLGKTLFGGTTPPSSADYGTSVDLEGMPYAFENRAVSDPITGRPGVIECILVRNVSTVVLLPGRLVTWKSGQRGRQVDGYSILDAGEVAGMVDDKIHATNGVPVGDLFWLMLKGQVVGKTDLLGDIGTNFSAGSYLVAQTAAASTGTTAGRLQLTTITAASTHLATLIQDNIKNSVGRAVSANTTGQTDRSVLIDLDIRV